MCSSDPADTLWAIMITCISSRGPRLPALLPPTMTQRVDVLSLDGFASHASIVNYGTSKLACHLRSPGWKEERSWQTPYKKNKRYKNEGEKKRRERQELLPPPTATKWKCIKSVMTRTSTWWRAVDGREMGGMGCAKAFVVPRSLK